MKEFEKALTSQGKHPSIPEEDNWFGPLVGTWDMEWIDGHGTEQERHVPGEWIFSWVLEGTAIQDIFICPSRQARKTKTWPDAAYGTTIRIYQRQMCIRDRDRPDRNHAKEHEMDFFRHHGSYVPLEKHPYPGWKELAGRRRSICHQKAVTGRKAPRPPGYP